MKKRLSYLLSCCALALASLGLGQTCQVQFIHGSADQANQVVDIWVDSVKVADNLAFREATPFISLPSDQSFVVHVCDSSSTSIGSPIHTWQDSLENGINYHFTLFGLTDSLAGYDPFIPLQWTKAAALPAQTAIPGNVVITMLHCVTNEAAIDVSEIREDLGSIATSLATGSYSSPVEIGASRYRLRLGRVQDNSTITEIEALLYGDQLEDSAVVVMISGFGSDNFPIGSPKLAVHMVYRSGLVAELPVSTATVQFIHNAPDNEIPLIDIFSGTSRIINNLAFRAVSGPIPVPSGVPLTIAVTRDTAISANDALITQELIAEAEESYLSIIQGAVSPNLSAIAPLSANSYKIRPEANLGNLTDAQVLHGSPDLPLISVFESSTFNSTIANDLSYAEMSLYTSLPQAPYVFDLIDASSSTKIASYMFDLQQLSLEGEAITIVVSGWSDTSLAAELPKLGLWLAKTTSGKMIEIPRTVGIDELSEGRLLMYPNPVSSYLTIRSVQSIGSIQVTDMKGNLLRTFATNNSIYSMPVLDLPSGLYLIECENENAIYRQKFVVQH